MDASCSGGERRWERGGEGGDDVRNGSESEQHELCFAALDNFREQQLLLENRWLRMRLEEMRARCERRERECSRAFAD